MARIKIKSLSVNQCWQGRRFKTQDYKTYEAEMFYLLPAKIVMGEKVKLSITFGFSNKASDIDNPVKPFIDILQKRFGFNDKTIYKLEVEKKIVKKGSEYIDFNIESC
jgi:Holliday junction resolvase RusA-like endonuclease